MYVSHGCYKRNLNKKGEKNPSIGRDEVASKIADIFD